MSITVIRGDEYPVVQAQLFVRGINREPDVPYDAREAVAIQGLFKARGGDEILTTIIGVLVAGGDNNKVNFAFGTGVLDVEPGEYSLWFRVIVDAGGIQTLLKPLQIRVINGPEGAL